MWHDVNAHLLSLFHGLGPTVLQRAMAAPIKAARLGKMVESIGGPVKARRNIMTAIIFGLPVRSTRLGGSRTDDRFGEMQCPRNIARPLAGINLEDIAILGDRNILRF